MAQIRPTASSVGNNRNWDCPNNGIRNFWRKNLGYETSILSQFDICVSNSNWVWIAFTEAMSAHCGKAAIYKNSITNNGTNNDSNYVFS